MSGDGTFRSSPPFTHFTFTNGCVSSLPASHGGYMQHEIDVGPKPAVPVALAFNELYEAPILKKV